MEPGAGYRSATESAAVFDRSGRGKIAVAGNDRRTYLHAMLTNDIASLQAGSGCYAAYLTPQGRMIADMIVLELGDLLLLDLDRSMTATVLEKLDQFVFSEDVKLGDLTEAFGKLAVAGPTAASVVAGVLGGDGRPGPSASDFAGWPDFRNVRASFRGQMALVAASHEVGVPGFDLYVERPHVEALTGALVAAGAMPAGPAVWDVLRVEAGRPAFGIDMDAETIPLEAGIEGRAISLTKGCYPGQEIVIRVLHRGHGRVARRIAGLLVAGSEVPHVGDRLRAGDREAGRITSAVWSPRAGGPIALAMVHRDFLEPGTELMVLHGDQTVSSTVVTLPFEPR
ncbi:MAG TPA: glycine cleavage T C-terminal barrel domain-containing protein [Vicinamibacterales bacterium]